MSLADLPDELVLIVLFDAPITDMIEMCHTNTRISKLCRQIDLAAKFRTQYPGFNYPLINGSIFKTMLLLETGRSVYTTHPRRSVRITGKMTIGDLLHKYKVTGLTRNGLNTSYAIYGTSNFVYLQYSIKPDNQPNNVKLTIKYNKDTPLYAITLPDGKNLYFDTEDYDSISKEHKSYMETYGS